MIWSVIVLVMKSYVADLTPQRILSTKNKNFLIIFLVFDGETSRKNAKFRASTYIHANDPSWGFLSQFTKVESVFLPKINIFEF